MTKYRLTSNPFQRQGNFLEPRRAIVLSLEGTVTECDYFRGLRKAIAKGKVDLPPCIIEPLERGDTKSDPGSVIELLEECLGYAGSDVTERLPKWFVEKYERRTIEKYLAKDLTGDLLQEFEDDLALIGIDLHYAHFLSQFNPSTDVFGIVIDHDQRQDLKTHVDYCAEKGYNVFLTNPCFEFWLLLHLTEVKANYSMDKLKENPKVSRKHRYITSEISRLSHSSKTVDFKRKYLPNLKYAIRQALEFETDIYGLLSNVGTNIPLLFEIIEEKRQNMWE